MVVNDDVNSLWLLGGIKHHQMWSWRGDEAAFFWKRQIEIFILITAGTIESVAVNIESISKKPHDRALDSDVCSIVCSQSDLKLVSVGMSALFIDASSLWTSSCSAR